MWPVRLPGCRPYAEAINQGDAINKCPPGGEATILALADMLGRDPAPLDGEAASEDTVAYIREAECIGCTKCIQACPVDAIIGAAKQMHTVIEDECTGCDLCVAPCPVDCIDMLPRRKPLTSGAHQATASHEPRMPAYEFPGGIYPPERKERSNQAPLRTASLPKVVTLPLSQHTGKAALPCVNVGDAVKTGTLVARRDGMVSANVHASISGTVIETTNSVIIIQGDGEDLWATLPPLDWRTAERDTLLQRLDDSGLIGLGAGFPTYIKAQVSEHHAIDTLVVNAAECEPYITADDLTLRHYAADVPEGAQLLARLCGPRTSSSVSKITSLRLFRPYKPFLRSLLTANRSRA